MPDDRRQTHRRAWRRFRQNIRADLHAEVETLPLPFHSLADAFPLIDGPLFNDLVASIKANGLRHPIVMLNGEILDGRNRYPACEVAGVEPQFEQFTGSDTLAFVIDENLTRRHLNESQRAMVAARLAKAKAGERTDLVEISTRSMTAVRPLNE